MPYKDLREFMALLESKGLLARVKAEVDPEWEINGITNKLICDGGPAVLFENVKGHKVPLLCNLIGTVERLALALEMPNDDRAITEEWLKRTERTIPPKRVKTGPCKENILLGDKADLNVVFAPVKWHKLDGGPYIGTLGLQVTRDPATGVQNVGIYRMMVRTKNETSLFMAKGQHGDIHLKKWEQLYPGKPMPIAVAIGTEPAYLLAGGAKLSHPPGEDDYAGALRGQPIELVKCETCDLEVPATAEIVLEGETYANELKPCGPFGEYTGHEGGVQNFGVFHLKAITHRNNFIFHGEREGHPSETGLISTKGLEYLAYARIKKFPGVMDIHIPRWGVMFHMIVSVRKLWPGYVNHVIHTIWGDKDISRFFKYVVVVDENVNIRDPEMVGWAICNYVQPDRDILMAPKCPDVGLDVSQPYSKRFYTTKWGVDATMKTEEYAAEGREPPPLCDDPDIRARVEAQWGKYGIKMPEGKRPAR